MSKVRVLYDFQAEGQNELSTYTGEELVVIDSKMFDGWIQVRNSRGSVGIVPSTYVENIIGNDDDEIPPPPSYANVPSSNINNSTVSWESSYSNITPNSAYSTSNTTSTSNNQNPYVNQSYYPTSWDNPTTNTNAGSGNQRPVSYHDDDDSDDFDDESPNYSANSSANNETKRRSTLTTNASAGTLSKAKAKNSYGLDVFLLHGAVKNVMDSDRFSSIILNAQRQSVWKRQSPPYQVSIIGYTSDKKYHGVKKFISYEIQAKIFPQRVKRRYNHFDWLHKRLVEKYPNICIPPLPDKAVAGNFDEDFINKRKTLLEMWLNRMAAHPVVGQSEVFIHFLQCDDASSKWKAGKRKAEKDEYRGAQWFCTLTVPGESVDTPMGIKERVDKFARASIQMDASLKNVSSALEKLASFHSSSYKKELLYFGKKLEELGLALSNESMDAPNNSALSTALVTTGNTYAQIGNNYGEQAKVDITALLDRFFMYRGILQQMPDMMHFEKSAIQSVEEFQQRPDKAEGKPISEIAPRREIISHVTFAEINLFNKDKVDDITQYMKTFLQQQIAFYTEVTDCLKRAYSNFEKIPVENAGQSPGYFNQSFKK